MLAAAVSGCTQREQWQRQHCGRNGYAHVVFVAIKTIVVGTCAFTSSRRLTRECDLPANVERSMCSTTIVWESLKACAQLTQRSGSHSEYRSQVFPPIRVSLWRTSR